MDGRREIGTMTDLPPGGGGKKEGFEQPLTAHFKESSAPQTSMLEHPGCTGIAKDWSSPALNEQLADCSFITRSAAPIGQGLWHSKCSYTLQETTMRSSPTPRWK